MGREFLPLQLHLTLELRMIQVIPLKFIFLHQGGIHVVGEWLFPHL